MTDTSIFTWKQNVIGYTAFILVMAILMVPLSIGVYRASIIESTARQERLCKYHARQVNQYALKKGLNSPCII